MEVPQDVIVSFSGGKDSLALIDVCASKFRTIKPFFLYWIKGLHFQEVVLQRTEQRYGVQILRLPHFELPSVLAGQTLTWFRPSYPEFRRVRMREIQDYVRRKFELTWIATGEKKCDSLQRRLMMKKSGQWDAKRSIVYPLWNFTNTQIFTYLQLRHITLPPEYRFMRGSWGGIRGAELYEIKKHFPDDYHKILEVFPFAESIERRFELYGQSKEGAGSAQEDGSTEVRDAQDAPQ